MVYHPACAALMLLVLTGCASKPKDMMPEFQLPAKPVSTDIECEDLTPDEEIVCLGQGAEARNMCRKVQRNRIICTDQQAFVKRLYKERGSR